MVSPSLIPSLLFIPSVAHQVPHPSHQPCPHGLSSLINIPPLSPGRYPIQAIGPAQHANLHGALSLSVQSGEAAVGVAVTAEHPQAVVTLERRRSGAEAGEAAPAQVLLQQAAALGPAAPLGTQVALPPGCAAHDLTLRVLSGPAEAGGQCLLEYSPAPPAAEGEQQVPDAATEPPAPQHLHSVDELYLTGVALSGVKLWHSLRGVRTSLFDVVPPHHMVVL